MEQKKSALNFTTGSVERAARRLDATDGADVDREIALSQAAAILALAHELSFVRNSMDDALARGLAVGLIDRRAES